MSNAVSNVTVQLLVQPAFAGALAAGAYATGINGPTGVSAFAFRSQSVPPWAGKGMAVAAGSMVANGINMVINTADLLPADTDVGTRTIVQSVGGAVLAGGATLAVNKMFGEVQSGQQMALDFGIGAASFMGSQVGVGALLGVTPDSSL